MNYLQWSGVLAGAMALALASPVAAHHSHAMFDHTKQISVSGTVTDFDFRNPHASLLSTWRARARSSIIGSRCRTYRT